MSGGDTLHAARAFFKPLTTALRRRVMAGLVPAIHAFISEEKGVDARNKSGHDTR